MGTGPPTPDVMPVHAAPKNAPRPTCGRHGRRKRTFTRTVGTVTFKAVVYLEITCGEYQAKCDCRKLPRGVPPRAFSDNKVRDLVLDRVLKDGMSVERTLESLTRESLIDLSSQRVSSMTCFTTTPGNSTWPRAATRSWNSSAARFASMNCSWAASRCSWPTTRSPTCPWPSPWSARTTRAGCGGSS